jgi:methyltransferase (TIGR00027 family)
VDHPATQMVKLEKLQKIIAPLPDHVTFVPIDFHTQDLKEQLFRYGYSQERKTLFIWQGVTVYLNAEAVDSTLSFIAQNATSGSTVIFDYYYNETLQDTSRTDVKNMHRTARITGENYLFGIEEGELDAFLTDRGFQDVHCATSNTLKNQYFTGVNATRTIISGIAIASAQVR